MTAHAKEVLPSLSAIWACALINSRQPCPWPKNNKENQFEITPNYLLALDAHMSRAGPDRHLLLWLALITS